MGNGFQLEIGCKVARDLKYKTEIETMRNYCIRINPWCQGKIILTIFVVLS